MLKSFLNKDKIEAGCDEAGRGCLAGAVFAASVILPKENSHLELNDSKKLSKKKREELRIIIEKNALAWSVQFVNQIIIDKINIYKSTYKAMHMAVNNLQIKPEHLLIDGNRFIEHPDKIPYTCIVKGDGKYLSIAAASILAKTYRDNYMLKIHKEFPNYLWNENKGYATKKHRDLIRTHGICKYHRKSFNLLGQPKFNF